MGNWGRSQAGGGETFLIGAGSYYSSSASHVTKKRKGLSLIFSCHSLEVSWWGLGVGWRPDTPLSPAALAPLFSHTATIKKTFA